MRLIDADALIDAGNKVRISTWPTDHPSDAIRRQGNIFVKLVESAPTIDAVPVVRCRECKNSERSSVWDGWQYCTINHIHHSGDNYCSYGERRSEDDEDKKEGEG